MSVVCLRAGLTWVRVRFISPFAVSALKHGCSEALPTSQLIPTARVSAAWAAARDKKLDKEAHAAVKAQLAQERAATIEAKKMDKLRIATEQKAEKARLAAESKAKRGDAKVRIYSPFSAVHISTCLY